MTGVEATQVDDTEGQSSTYGYTGKTEVYVKTIANVQKSTQYKRYKIKNFKYKKQLDYGLAGRRLTSETDMFSYDVEFESDLVDGPIQAQEQARALVEVNTLELCPSRTFIRSSIRSSIRSFIISSIQPHSFVHSYIPLFARLSPLISHHIPARRQLQAQCSAQP